jgi:hypothetical protein
VSHRTVGGELGKEFGFATIASCAHVASESASSLCSEPSH